MISALDTQSTMELLKLNRLNRDYQKQGVVFVAIHPDAGFDKIQEKIASGKVTIPVARDKDGVFAKAMHTDDFPDTYIIDRAGNLRYADIEKTSVKTAVKMLASETIQTATENAKRQSEGLDVVAAQKTAEDIDPSKYKNADWPDHNDGRLSAKNMQGKQLPVPLGNEKWVNDERPLEGKVLVIDFWATWCPPCRAAAPILKTMQNNYDGRIQVVGLGGSEPYADFAKYVIKEKCNYAQLFDENQILDRAMEVKGIPHVVVVSTDGVIRWQGNPLDPTFKVAVAKTIAADPLLEANN